MCKFYKRTVFIALLISLLIFNGNVFAQAVVANSDRCLSGRSQSGLLLTQWSASEKANLQSLVTGPAIAVEYRGCSLRIIPQCHLGGHYEWLKTTPATDVMQINNEVDLYTKLPLGVFSLLGELKRGSSISVETTVSGQMRLHDFISEDVTNSTACSKATHIIKNLSVGAFTISSQKESGYGLGVDTSVVGVGGRNSRRVNVLKSAGDKMQCGTSNKDGPSDACSAPLHVFLSPIPGRADEDGPPDTVKVYFASGDSSTIWDVYVNNEAVCSTPCNRWVGPSTTVAIRSRGNKSFGGNPFSADSIPIRNLDLDSGPMQVTTKSASTFKFVAGINGMVWGGMSLMIGTIGVASCDNPDNSISCTGSYSLLSAGLALAGIGAWAMFDSGPKIKIKPVFKAQSSMRNSYVKLKPVYRFGIGYFSLKY